MAAGILLAVAGGAILIPKIVKGFQTLKVSEGLDFDVDVVKWKRPTGGKINIDITLRFKNIVDYPIELNTLLLNFYLSSFKIANLDAISINETIPASGVRTLTFPVQTTAIWLLTTELGAELLKGNFPDKIRITGSAKANDFVAEINKEYPLISE